MAITINGTTGIAGVDGSASTPAVQGADTNTGVFYPAADTVGVSTGGSERVRVDSSGNVGIGTSSPSYKLDVRSTFAVLDGSSNIGFYANGTTYTQVWQTLQSTNDFLLKTTAAKYIAFLPNNSEAMRIGSDGAVFMNTTSNWSGNAILNVVGANWVVSGYSTGTATNTGAFLSRVDNTNCRLMMFYYGATTNVGYITTNGTTTSYGSASDYRLKENIAPMTGALAKVALLKPVTYTWKSDGSDGQGFIAHELQEVVPNCVAGEKDAVDSDGKPQYQAVDTSFLVATLTAAIQEQQTLIQQLQADVAALKGTS